MAVPIRHTQAEVIYPERDGKRMSDNTKQFDWIMTIKGGLDALFRDDPKVFVAGDLLWYPVEGENKIRQAPDAMVAFGRPKGHRGSYLQWLEGNIAPQVVFEVLSPGNKPPEMERKRQFYARYGVEEYYEYDPDHGTLDGWKRSGRVLVPVTSMRGWRSPLLHVLFDLHGEDLVLIGPDGRRFENFVKVAADRDLALAHAEEAENRAVQAEAELERLRALLRERGLSEE